MTLLRKLGNTALEISPIGLGTWQFSNGGNFVGGYWAALAPDVMRDIVATAIDAGINWFDTAEMYGDGSSEHNLAKALRAAGRSPGDVVIASKWWPVMRTANSLRDTIDVRLQCLEGFTLDLHQVHQPFSISSVEKQMHAMADLLDAGKIRAAGISNFSAKAMCKADDVLRQRGYSLASNQVRYNLLARQIEHNGILQEAKDRGITIIAWSPLEQAMLTGRLHRDPGYIKQLPWMRRQLLQIQKRRIETSRPLIEALERIGQKNNVTASQVALNWLINYHGETVVAIPGASRASQVIDNAHTMQFRLAQDEMEELATILPGRQNS